MAHLTREAARCAAVALFTLLTCAIRAQQTWVVDQSGLGNFTSMPPAIAAASPGDTIVVRAGHYLAFTVDRSLHFVGEGRPLWDDFSNTTSGLNLSVSGVDMRYCTVTASVCTFEDVRFDYTCDLAYSSGVMVGCENTITGAPYHYVTVALNGANYAFDSCVLGGSSALIFPSLGCGLVRLPQPALSLTANSSASIAGCTLTGGAHGYSQGCGFVPGNSAIDVESGSVARVTQSLVLGGALQFGSIAPPINNAGAASAVLVDPSVQFNAFPPNVTTAAVPSLTGQGDVVGGAMACQLQTAPQRPAAIVASIGSRAPIASPFGSTWVDLGAFVVLRLGGTDAAGMMATSIALPLGLTRGLPITVQAVVQLGPAPVLLASGPTVLHVL